MKDISDFPQSFTANFSLQEIAGRREPKSFVKMPCSAVFFKHPQEDIRISLFPQLCDGGFQKALSIAFSHVLRQKIYGNHFTPSGKLFKTGTAKAACPNNSAILHTDYRLPIRVVDTGCPPPRRNRVKVILGDDAPIGIFPAFSYTLLIFNGSSIDAAYLISKIQPSQAPTLYFIVFFLIWFVP